VPGDVALRFRQSNRIERSAVHHVHDTVRIVVVEKILLQNSSKMLFGKYNHVVETLAANTADQAFGVWPILPESR
jgi:hypothetical protein